MKSLFIGAVLFSSTAFACPDISGLYSCKYNSNMSTKEIVKTEQGFVINSDGNSMEYLADGKAYEVPSTDSYTDALVRTTCTQNEMIVDFKASILYDGSIIAKQVSKSTYAMDGKDLIISQKVKMKGIPLPAIKWTCVRNY